jgi:putative transposase
LTVITARHWPREDWMRKSKWTEAQIIGWLQEIEAGTSVAELCRRIGVSKETVYTWRKQFGGMKVSDAKRLRQLEDENRALKRVVADQALNIQVLKDVVGKTW